MADEAQETMRDRGRFWSPVPDWREARIEGRGLSVRRIGRLSQALVSGDLAAARAALAADAAEAGSWTVAPGDAWVRIARDRALLVALARPNFAPGWNAAGFAVTPADDLFAILELSGPGLRDLVAEAVSTDFDRPSPSAAVGFAGMTALLYRTAKDTARLHVEAPLATALWTWLEASIIER